MPNSLKDDNKIIYKGSKLEEIGEIEEGKLTLTILCC